ncbi:MAG TPA: MarR family winged helix-turn-helix transcriptional regulator [Polyangiaceae bacterium]
MKSRPRPPSARTDARPPASVPPPDLDYRALAEFRHQIRLFLMFSESEAREAGIEPQQHQLLLALKGLPEGQRPTIGVLAERLQLRHHTVVGLVDRLVVAKLVTRLASETDGREILVRITAGGERTLRALSLAHHEELRTLGPALVRALESLLRAEQSKTRSKSVKRRP